LSSGISQRDVKEIQKRYLKNIDEVREDTMVKYKGNFIIQKLGESNKFDLIYSPSNVRKNTSPKNVQAMYPNPGRRHNSGGNFKKNHYETFDEVIYDNPYKKKLIPGTCNYRETSPLVRNFNGIDYLAFDENLDSNLIVEKYGTDKFGEKMELSLLNAPCSIDNPVNIDRASRNKLSSSLPKKMGA
jgi:hypothetical protein